MSDAPLPTPTDDLTRRVDLIVERTQRALLETVDEILNQRADRFLKNAKETLVQGVDEAIRQNADPLMQQLKGTLLTGAEELIRAQLDPFLDQTQQRLRAGIEELTKHDAHPIVERGLRVLLDAIEGVRRERMTPWLDRTKDWIKTSAGEAVASQVNLVMVRLKEFVDETVVTGLRVKIPAYSGRVGQQLVTNLLAGTFFCLAAIFLLVGIVVGLRQAGMPEYVSYLAGGGLALLAGFVFLKLSARTFAQAPPRKEAGP